MIPRYAFTRSFDISIPTREAWKGTGTDLVIETVEIFTNDSKFDGAVIGGIFSEPLGETRSIILPDYCNVF